MNANRITLLLIACFFSIAVYSQSQLFIYHPAKDSALANRILLLDFPETQPVRLNDTTLVFNYRVESPLYFMLLFDEPGRWTARLWAQPGDTRRAIRINYEASTSKILDLTPTDQFLEDWCAVFDLSVQPNTDAMAEAYIRDHPTDYVSLWMLTHGAFRSDRTGRARAFKLLSPGLDRYASYRELKMDLEQRRIPKKGETFKEFEAYSSGGSLLNTQNIRNKVILLHFWSNNCGPCVHGMDDLVAFYKTLDTSRVAFISVALDAEKEKWLRSATSAKIAWTSLWQENNLRCELCLHYNLSAIPLFVLFGTDKRLHEIIEGEQLVAIKQELDVLLKK